MNTKVMGTSPNATPVLQFDTYPVQLDTAWTVQEVLQELPSDH